MFPAAFALSLGVALLSNPSTQKAHAQQKAAEASEPETSGQRMLTFEEALDLGLKQNRDIQGARERLRGAHADVERALATLLPTLNAQAKVTVNFPQVSLSLDQSGSVLGSVIQGAEIADLNLKNGTTPTDGPLTKAILDKVCRTPGRVNPAGVTQACSQFTSGTVPDLDAALNGANIQAVITPQVQLDALIAANIPLVVPSAYPALQGAKLSFKAQEKQLEVTATQVLQSIATAFYAVAGNEEVLGARRHAIDVAQKTVDNTRVRLSAGVVNRVEVTRAELALIQAQQRVLEAQDAKFAAYRTLGTMLRLPPGSFKVVPPPEQPMNSTTTDQLTEQALRQRPEIGNLELTIRANSSQISSAWLRWAPTLSAFGNIRLTNATGFAGRPDYYAIGAQIDWLIFDGFNRDAQRHQDLLPSQSDMISVRLLGDDAKEESNDRHDPGLADASNYVAIASGMVRSLSVYHSAGDVNQLIVGLYDDVGGHPKNLLNTGTLTSPVVGAWNTVAVAPVAVTAGRTYWIAIVAPVGSGTTFSFPYGTLTGPITEHSLEVNLTAMPALWTSGQIFPNTICSWYASQ